MNHKKSITLLLQKRNQETSVHNTIRRSIFRLIASSIRCHKVLCIIANCGHCLVHQSDSHEEHENQSHERSVEKASLADDVYC